MQNSIATILTPPVTPNLKNYDILNHSFNWANQQKSLHGLPGHKGLNIAYEATERHATGKLKNIIVLRWIRKDEATRDFTFYDLHNLSSRFANVLTTLGVKKGERVLHWLVEFRNYISRRWAL